MLEDDPSSAESLLPGTNAQAMPRKIIAARVNRFLRCVLIDLNPPLDIFFYTEMSLWGKRPIFNLRHLHRGLVKLFFYWTFSKI
jgi:hypothetical protein